MVLPLIPVITVPRFKTDCLGFRFDTTIRLSPQAFKYKGNKVNKYIVKYNYKLDLVPDISLDSNIILVIRP